MQSISTPLNRLHEDGSWFARAHELRLWLVRCDENLRKAALALIPKLEFHADNRGSWPVLVDAHTASDDGWQSRTHRLHADWARRVEAFAEVGVVLPVLETSSRAAGLAGFRASLAAISRTIAELSRAWVVVLAPTIVERSAAFELALAQLLGDVALQRIRWVLLLDIDVRPPERLLDSLGRQQVLVGEYRVDEGQQRRELVEMLRAPDPARFGIASPADTRAPRRVDDPPPLPQAQRDEALRAAGIEPVVLDAAAQIRSNALAAALAMKDGEGLEALTHQRAARDLCATAGLIELQIIARITLASYLAGLDQRELAKLELHDAVELARAAGLQRAESQAHLALGLLHGLDRAHPSAMQSYVEAAKAAEAAHEASAAIEAWRMAAHLAAQIGQDDIATSTSCEALRVVASLPVAARPSTSAAEAARQLAQLCERHRLTARAASLHDQADAIEAGEEFDHVGEQLPRSGARN